MKVFLVLICIFAASPVSALSCLRPDVVSTFEYARDAKEGFWIIRGFIKARGPIAVPTPDANGRYEDDASASTTVSVTGRGLRPGGGYSLTQQEVTLTITCLAHWCGSVSLEDELFMAIEVKESGPELLVDPCSSRVVSYTEDGEARLMRCVRDEICERE